MCENISILQQVPWGFHIQITRAYCGLMLMILTERMRGLVPEQNSVHSNQQYEPQPWESRICFWVTQINENLHRKMDKTEALRLPGKGISNLQHPLSRLISVASAAQTAKGGWLCGWKTSWPLCWQKRLRRICRFILQDVERTRLSRTEKATQVQIAANSPLLLFRLHVAGNTRVQLVSDQFSDTALLRYNSLHICRVQGNKNGFNLILCTLGWSTALRWAPSYTKDTVKPCITACPLHSFGANWRPDPSLCVGGVGGWGMSGAEVSMLANWTF